MHQQNLPQYGKVIHSLENRYKFKAINDIYKDYLKICLNFHIFATLHTYKNKGAAQGQLPTGGETEHPSRMLSQSVTTARSKHDDSATGLSQPCLCGHGCNP